MADRQEEQAFLHLLVESLVLVIQNCEESFVSEVDIGHFWELRDVLQIIWVFGVLNLAKGLSPDRDLLEVHDVAGKSPCLVAKDVLYLAKFLVETRAIHRRCDFGGLLGQIRVG